LFVRDNVGQILQHRVRGYGKSRRTSNVREDTPDARAERQRTELCSNRTVLPRTGEDHRAMTKKKKLNTKIARAALASVTKEMARPRFAESARKKEEEASHRATKHDSFMNT
jgi:septal ring factor EnvC (AmiA/AmiB activator)